MAPSRFRSKTPGRKSDRPDNEMINLDKCIKGMRRDNFLTIKLIIILENVNIHLSYAAKNQSTMRLPVHTITSFQRSHFDRSIDGKKADLQFLK